MATTKHKAKNFTPARFRTANKSNSTAEIMKMHRPFFVNSLTSAVRASLPEL